MIKITVAKVVYRILEKLFPTNIVEKKFSGVLTNMEAFLARLILRFFHTSRRKRLNVINAASDPAKKNDKIKPRIARYISILI
jgi:hypothetical protein